MRYLYTLLFYLAIPFILIRLIWRGLRNPAYLRRWPERFGYFTPPSHALGGIWLHAVSAGEVIAAIPLIKALQREYPHLPITVTAGTPTGSALIINHLQNTVFHVYQPYDIPTAISRFLSNLQPRLLIVLETELWPNLFYQCNQKKIPIVIANARLSQRSLEGYRRIRLLIRQTLNCITTLAAQSPDDAQRFAELGLPKERIQNTGNLKFDFLIPENLQQQALELRQTWGDKRFIWVAASTHRDEEEQILQAFKLVKHKIPNCLLVVAPRHPERFYTVADLCQQQGYKVELYSNHQPCTTDIDIIIGDAMGKLLLFYAAADVAFVGGSLIPHGGHNLLEPAGLAKVPITGPYYFNFAYIHELLNKQHAVLTVQDYNELAQEIIRLSQHAEECQRLGEQAQQVIRKNQGALAHLLAILRTHLAALPPLQSN